VFDLLNAKDRYYDYEFERYWHFYQVWGRLGYNPATPTEHWDREFVRRFGAAGPHLEAGLHRASEVLPMIVAAVYPYRRFPTTRGWAERQAMGDNLPEYATNDTTDIQQFESPAEAAQRILAGGTTTRRTPEATSQWFDDTAKAILAHVNAAETAGHGAQSKEFKATVIDLKILAQLARFHARRWLAAVHYNLFLQGKNSAELQAAIAGERAAIEEWQTLIAVAGDHYTSNLAMGSFNSNLTGHWRDELKTLETGLSDLISSTRKEKTGASATPVWTPKPLAADAAPQVVAKPVAAIQPIEPLTIRVNVSAPSGIESVRLRYRHVTQFEDYETLSFTRVGASDEFTATVPGKFIVPEWDFMYFIEATSRSGQGTQWPNLAEEAPYVILKPKRD